MLFPRVVLESLELIAVLGGEKCERKAISVLDKHRVYK